MFVATTTVGRAAKDQLKSSLCRDRQWWDDLEKKGVITKGGELAHRNTATTVRRVKGR